MKHIWLYPFWILQSLPPLKQTSSAVGTHRSTSLALAFVSDCFLEIKYATPRVKAHADEQ